MKFVWRTLVSVSFMAAIGAGCGSGNDGTPGAILLPTETSPQSTTTPIQKQRLLTVKDDEFKEPRLLANKQSDILLVWDAQTAGGGIRSMFYQSGNGWGGVQQVAPQPLDGIVNELRDRVRDVFLDDQGNAVVLVGAGIYLSNAAAQIWKKVEWPVVANGVNASALVVDNSDKSVAMFSYFVGLTKDSSANFYTDIGIGVYKLHEDGTWEDDIGTSVLVGGDKPLPLCFTSRGTCILNVVASADDTGRLHVSYDVAENGKRVSTWTDAAGWSAPHILDRNHITNFRHESFLSVNGSDNAVAIWQSWRQIKTAQGNFETPFIDGRKTAWFDGTSWLSTEIAPDTMAKIELVSVGADGSTVVLGEDVGIKGISFSQRAGMRRSSPSAPWMKPERPPIDLTYQYVNQTYKVGKFLEFPRGGWIVPFNDYYELKSSNVINPLIPTRMRIDEIRFGADGWSGVRTFPYDEISSDLLLVATHDKLIAVELETPMRDGKRSVNTFSLAIP